MYNMVFYCAILSFILPLMSLAAHAPSSICVLSVLTGRNKGIQKSLADSKSVTLVFLKLIVFCFQILCNCERAPSLSGIASTFTCISIKYSNLISEPQNILENFCDDTFGLGNWNKHWVCLSILWNLHNRIC